MVFIAVSQITVLYFQLIIEIAFMFALQRSACTMASVNSMAFAILVTPCSDHHNQG